MASTKRKANEQMIAFVIGLAVGAILIVVGAALYLSGQIGQAQEISSLKQKWEESKDE